MFKSYEMVNRWRYDIVIGLRILGRSELARRLRLGQQLVVNMVTALPTVLLTSDLTVGIIDRSVADFDS